MKIQFLAIVCTGLFAASASAASPPDSVSTLIKDYSSGYVKLGIPELQLSYVANLRALTDTERRAEEKAFFGAIKERLAALNAASADRCENLALKEIAFETNLNLQKLALLEKFLALKGSHEITEDGLHNLPLGREWYAYYLKRWLSVDTTPEDLMKFGKHELTIALLRYRELQAKMGYAGRDQEFYAYLAGADFHYPDGQTPEADYAARQRIVLANLHKLFLQLPIDPPMIKQSSLGLAMPADAYYEPDEKTFYFNKAKPHYERRNLDWLLLHESMPGHHFQYSYARVGAACPVVLPDVFYAAYVEGWGAYVEEFGGELGLYRKDADALGAVEWDLVRSIRVVLDVGINDDGWSAQQATDYWHEMLPMIPDLAEREIARVRNWPAQAIAYKLGAAEIRRARSRAQAEQGTNFDIRVFHDAVLRHGAVPLVLLPDLVKESLKQ